MNRNAQMQSMRMTGTVQLLPAMAAMPVSSCRPRRHQPTLNHL